MLLQLSVRLLVLLLDAVEFLSEILHPSSPQILPQVLHILRPSHLQHDPASSDLLDWLLKTSHVTLAKAF